MTDLQFIDYGSNPASNLKLSKFHENFCHISKTFCNNFWSVNTCCGCIVRLGFMKLKRQYLEISQIAPKGIIQLIT